MASKVIQYRGGTTTEHSSFVGADREVTVDTTKKTLVVHDGVTVGGTPLAKASDITTINSALTTKQPIDADLTAIAGLAGTNGLLKKTAADTWTLDTTVYAPNTHVGSTGTAHGNATTTVAGFMSNTDKTKLDGIAAGAQVNVATDLSLGTATATTIPLNSSTGTDVILPAVTTTTAGLMGSADKVKLDGISGVNTGDQTITLTGDVTGSGTGSFVATLKNSGVTAGTYKSVTVDAKGIVTAGTNPTTLAGYGITDAYTKTELDTLVQGLKAKQSVVAATTANITLSGVQTIDGVALVAGNRVLVKDQTTASANGIYVVATGAWTRSTDADIASEITSAYVFVEKGTTNADTGWVMTTDTVTLGTTALTWVKFTNNNYILSAANASTLGGVKVSGTTQTVAANAVTATAAKTYAVQLDASNNAVVNVPWTDTNTITTVENVLTSTSVTNALSAAQGKALADSKISKVTSTNNAITRFDGTTGLVQNSKITIDDYGTMAINEAHIIGPDGYGNLQVSGDRNLILSGDIIQHDNPAIFKSGDSYNPGISFDIDRTSGIYSSDAGKISIATNGTWAARWDGSDYSSAGKITANAGAESAGVGFLNNSISYSNSSSGSFGLHNTNIINNETMTAARTHRGIYSHIDNKTKVGTTFNSTTQGAHIAAYSSVGATDGSPGKKILFGAHIEARANNTTDSTNNIIETEIGLSVNSLVNNSTATSCNKIRNQYGAKILVGGTTTSTVAGSSASIDNRYGLFIQNQSAIATRDIGIYQQGSDLNIFMAPTSYFSTVDPTVSNPNYSVEINSSLGNISLKTDNNFISVDGNGINFWQAAENKAVSGTINWFSEESITLAAVGLSTAVNGTAKISRIGRMVTLTLPQISGTSNATSFSLTGLPTAYRPTATRYIVASVTDNGASYIEDGYISTTGTVVFSRTFAASGTKAVNATNVSYLI